MKNKTSNWKKVTSLQDLVNNWDSYLVKGKLLPREKLLEMCKECGGERFHRLGCDFEKGVCGIHDKIISCDCPHREGEEL